LVKKEDAEQDMLDMAFEPNKFSRLGCQITISDDLDGMVVKMPLKQA
jgi:2Fe-2S ferredoxin